VCTFHPRVKSIVVILLWRLNITRYNVSCKIATTWEEKKVKTDKEMVGLSIQKDRELRGLKEGHVKGRNEWWKLVHSRQTL